MELQPDGYTPTDKEVELGVVIANAQYYVWRRITLFRALSPKPWSSPAKIWHKEMCEVHGHLLRSTNGFPKELRTAVFARIAQENALVRPHATRHDLRRK